MKSIGVKQFLHVRTADHPVYHPEGNQLTFITNYSGLPQVWDLTMSKGWPTQASFTDERVIFVKYIPGTNRRIVGMDVGVNEKQQLFILEENGELMPLTNSPEHIHHFGGVSPDGKYLAWSSNRRHPAFFDIYVQNLETYESERVFKGDGLFKPVKWHPKGNSLLIEKINTNLDNDLGLLNIASGAVTWLTYHEGEAIFDSPQFNFDGDELYVLTNMEREFTGLASINITTKVLSWIDTRKWDLEGLEISSDKKKLAYTVNEGGVSKGILYDVQEERVNTWETPIGVITRLTFSPDDRKLAYVFNGPTLPSDIWELDIQLNRIKRLTYVSRSPIIEPELVEPELIHFHSFDRLEIPAFYYKPKHSKEKLPVVIFVHGGPESQIRAVYNPFLQYFLNRGYAVCTPNVRGSTGYGKTYSHLDDVEKRMDSVQDLTYLVEWLKTEGSADPLKIAIMGRSYGGFMVLAAITHYPEIWAAAIDIVGISSFRTFLENTSVWRRKLREAEYGNIEEHGEFFDQIDPIHHTDKINAPLMVLHGANDPRVPIEETEQIVTELKERNHPIQYIRFEDEGHFFVKLKNNIIAYTRVADFLEKYIGK
ncbi:S9 family peptidase [Heyndrickxia oleronia]|uniref:S9 family peptidase n=1 Tax=Heyndrickxia oleronia TaxID=38875 RepID=UPI000716F1FA|nr:S9 family peptidase [Heyndrickxia oleronia]MBU5210499.1 S9 family peptidase [Heyndrickxia oleronia]